MPERAVGGLGGAQRTADVEIALRFRNFEQGGHELVGKAAQDQPPLAQCFLIGQFERVQFLTGHERKDTTGSGSGDKLASAS